MAGDMPGEERSGEGLNLMTRDMLREERSPWGRGPTLVLPPDRYLGLSTLVTFSTGPIGAPLLMPNCLLHLSRLLTAVPCSSEHTTVYACPNEDRLDMQECTQP